ncbi:MAG: twin-arginine translocation signal domain-containing protein, partial [Calditrichaeota bacterium]|nr:twin-arginine translocation signal domain-containing protein [Calditrichota bacterium]
MITRRSFLKKSAATGMGFYGLQLLNIGGLSMLQ